MLASHAFTDQIPNWIRVCLEVLGNVPQDVLQVGIPEEKLISKNSYSIIIYYLMQPHELIVFMYSQVPYVSHTELW